MKIPLPALISAGCLLAGCESGSPDAAAEAEIPETLRPFGDGFPARGSPCRRLGESPATSNYLDHTRILVGCPGTRESAVVQSVIATGGHIVAEIDGVVMLSVPASTTGGQAN
jgi:hypothetical protein